MIKQEKFDQLRDLMDKLQIHEEDLTEKFILGSGRGGQKIQKTHSCVYLKHIPTGIEVKCQKDRSRETNRYLARKELCNKMEQILFKEKSKEQQRIFKIRKQKKRRSKKAKEKMIHEKKTRGEKKNLRKSVSLND